MEIGNNNNFIKKCGQLQFVSFILYIKNSDPSLIDNGSTLPLVYLEISALIYENAYFETVILNSFKQVGCMLDRFEIKFFQSYGP